MQTIDVQLWRVSPEVMARRVGEDAVLLDLATGTYFGLNQVGALAWDLLEQGLNLCDIRATVLQRFDVQAEQLDADLAVLIADLERHGLIQEHAPDN